MTEFYDIIGNLKTVLDAQPFVNTVTTGGLEDVDLNKQTIFPLSHIIVNSAIPKSSTIVFNISIIAMDIVDESKQETSYIFVGNDNEQDVLNQQLQVLNQVYQQLRHGQLFSELIQVTAEPSCEPFTDRFENKLAGWTMTFDVEVPNDMTICGTSIPSNCLDALVRNSDNTFSANLASGSITTFEDITIQTITSNQTIIDNLSYPSNIDILVEIRNTNLRNSNYSFNEDIPSCEPYEILDTEIVLKDSSGNIISTTDFPSAVSSNLTAPDGVVTIKKSNGTTIQTQSVKSNGTANSTVSDSIVTIKKSDGVNISVDNVKATDSLNKTISDSVVTLKDSAGTTISTINVKATETANITAPDGAITVNGSSVGSVKSNETRALLVKLNGTNSGVYDGVDTINVTDKNLFIKGIFKTANEAMDQLIVDSESAGTYISTTNDGSSGTITFRKNGSTISLPFTLAINDTLDVSRSITSSNGWFKLVGTYA